MSRATWNGAVIAESEDVVVVDGYTYFIAFWRGVRVEP